MFNQKRILIMKLHLTKISSNSKTGKIPVSTTSMESCPSTCPMLNNGCYANAGALRIHWSNVGKDRNIEIKDFLKNIKKFQNGQLWRHNQAGDLIHNDNIIDKEFLYSLVNANKGKRGFTYTHHTDKGHNYELINYANNNGFTVNMSANNKNQAVEYFNKGFPTVVVLETTAPNVQELNNVKIVACPAEKSDKVTCESCALCYNSKRNYIIGFRAHGSSKRKVELIASA